MTHETYLCVCMYLCWSTGSWRFGVVHFVQYVCHILRQRISQRPWSPWSLSSCLDQYLRHQIGLLSPVFPFYCSTTQHFASDLINILDTLCCPFSSRRSNNPINVINYIAAIHRLNLSPESEITSVCVCVLQRTQNTAGK